VPASTNGSTGVRDKLTSVREDIREAQGSLSDARREVQSVRERFAETGRAEDSRALARAINRTETIQTEIEALREDEREALRELDVEGDGGGGHDDEFLSEGTREVLAQMASSKMPVGRVALGEAVSRDELAGAFGGEVSRPMAAAPFTEVSEGARRGTSRGVRPALRRPTRLLDLFPSSPMDGASFDYVQESATFTGAAETVEGAVKPAVEVGFTDATAYAETVAVYTKLKKQAVEDQSVLASTVQSNLSYRVLRRAEGQILAGAGHGAGEIQGILNTTGIASVEYDAAALAADATLEGITTVLLSDAVPNFVALHPTDWADMLRAKAAGDGQYFGAGPFGAIASQLWEVPVIPTPAVTAGTALVGDAAIGATVLVRTGIQAFVSDADSDDFTRNRLTVLAEARLGLAVWFPQAFAVVELTEPAP
jgi:HK97 family phage major capsid protein